MAVTKTDFINYTRCPRFVALDEVKREKLDADITYEEYKEQENNESLKELLSNMFEDSEYTIDNTVKVNKQTEAMMPYYKQVEIEAGRVANTYFGGNSIYADATFDQVSFEFNKNGIKYICYVDIYNEVDEKINIIEVKATTSKKYVELKGSLKNGNKYSIFYFDKDNNTYRLKDELDGYDIESEMTLNTYKRIRSKLFDRYSDVGGYVFDLAVQRYILEGEYKSSGNEKSLENIHYYLAVLNHNYVFDGEYVNGKANYKKDKNGNEIVVYIDLTLVTKEYLSIISLYEEKLEEYIFTLDARVCPLGDGCERKTVRECPYFSSICGKMIPKKNSSLNYLNNGFGFKLEDGKRLKGLDLINEGYINMLDVPEEWITSKKHKIQRDAVKFDREYIDKDKIKAGLKCIEYPIYHLDFETMPCPLPRFRGEKPYTQSPFEFSLHIEKKPGVCDKTRDNYIFLADSFDKDEREDLVKNLIKYIDGSKGTLMAQNVSFEKGRIKELAIIFPEYSDKLMAIYDRGFDLIWLINTNKELYKKFGFDEDRSSLPNYYNKDLSGSYSIKKTLPVFSDLSYDSLTVKNGTEAIVAYASYNSMSREEFKLYYEALKIYCRQDTWAMVVILDALRKLCK